MSKSENPSSATEPLVLVLQPIALSALDYLRNKAEVATAYGEDAAAVEEVVAQVSGIVTRNAPIQADLLERAPKLRGIARVGVGTDHIDLAATTARRIPVAITPDANYRAVAEHTFALILAVQRRIVAADALVRRGRFQERDTLGGQSLHGNSLGVVGYGRVGCEVARIASSAFGMDVIVHDPFTRDPPADLNTVQNLDDLFAVADIVSLHVPLTPETHGLIGAEALSRMKRSAIIINTARGAVVESTALIDALRTGRLAGAGIDVYDEPPRADSPLVTLENVVLTPHIAAMTEQAFVRMSEEAVEAVLTILAGGRPNGVVNEDVWQNA